MGPLVTSWVVTLPGGPTIVGQGGLLSTVEASDAAEDGVMGAAEDHDIGGMVWRLSAAAGGVISPGIDICPEG